MSKGFLKSTTKPKNNTNKKNTQPDIGVPVFGKKGRGIKCRSTWGFHRCNP